MGTRACSFIYPELCHCSRQLNRIYTYMLGGWVNPHREQQTIPQGQTSLPPKYFSTPTANGRSAPRTGSARGVGRRGEAHTEHGLGVLFEPTERLASTQSHELPALTALAQHISHPHSGIDEKRPTEKFVHMIGLTRYVFIYLYKCMYVYYWVHPIYSPTRSPRRGRWHAPSSRHLRALLSVCGGCSFRGLGCCSCRVCVSVSGVLFSVGVCVCDLLIYLPIRSCATAHASSVEGGRILAPRQRSAGQRDTGFGLKVLCSY